MNIKVTTALVVIIGSVVVVGAFGYRALYGYFHLAEQRRDHAIGIRAVETLSSITRDAESGQRGFLLTGDPIYLAPYESAISRAEIAMNSVASKHVFPAEETRKLSEEVQAKMKELALTVHLASNGRRDEAMVIVRTGEGRKLMESVRKRAESLVIRSEGAILEKTKKLEQSASVALIAMPIVGAAAPIVVACSLAIGVKEFRARTRAETEAKLANEQAKQNAELLNAVSHDIRSPLNAIASYAKLGEMLLDSEQLDTANLRESLVSIRESAMRQAKLLDRYQELKRVERMETTPTRFGMCRAIEAAYNRVLPMAKEKGLAFEHQCDSSITLFSDEVKVQRIIWNILDNAVKFTERGAVRIEADTIGPNVVVSISDTGPGIAPDMRKHVFRDFTQFQNPERDPSKGFGLGLSISARLANQIGSTIALESKVGVGSVFTVTFVDF